MQQNEAYCDSGPAGIDRHLAVPGAWKGDTEETKIINIIVRVNVKKPSEATRKKNKAKSRTREVGPQGGVGCVARITPCNPLSMAFSY